LGLSCGGNGGSDGGLRKLRRVGPLAAALHIRELVAQRGDGALGKPACHCCHERVRHSGAGAVGENEQCLSVARRFE
jgi:hypothetical protein